MRKSTFAALTVLILSTFSCTENERAKNFGGNLIVNLECNQKLFDITWKDDDFWYATRLMHEDEGPEIYTFTEDSSYGIWKGKVSLVESRCPAQGK